MTIRLDVEYPVILDYFLSLRVLQTQALRVGQEKEPCIRVNTRELNRELCTRLSILYTNT